MIERPVWGWRYLPRLLLGALFLWASLAKIGNIDGFATDLHHYRILPLAFENILAMTLPWIEVLAGLALVLNFAPRAGSVILGVMLVVFIAAILSAMARDLDIACGCFGTSDATRTGWLAFSRDVAFLALAWFGYPRDRATTPLPTAHAHA
jgi:putative oxidoreductase